MVNAKHTSNADFVVVPLATVVVSDKPIADEAEFGRLFDEAVVALSAIGEQPGSAPVEELNRHGGPTDRGSADAYYSRPRDPHYYYGSTYQSKRVGEADMTVDQLVEYHSGYDEMLDNGDFKEL
tara:strand:+ start:466 stop:837 length:372 start_codon:yes stop_codon:yes gene_type:complete